VIKFAKLNLRNCLEDAAASIGNERTKLRVQDTGMDIIEGLASLVEFDGLGELLRRAVRSSWFLVRSVDRIFLDPFFVIIRQPPGSVSQVVVGYHPI